MKIARERIGLVSLLILTGLAFSPGTASANANSSAASGAATGDVQRLAVAPACVADATTLCLSHSRFQVRALWFAQDGRSGEGQAIPMTGDTGGFWFFNPSSLEVIVKVLNGCAFNSRYWTFAAGLTNVHVVLTVADTQTGAVQTYSNPQGIPFEPIQDVSAFAACP